VVAINFFFAINQDLNKKNQEVILRQSNNIKE